MTRYDNEESDIYDRIRIKSRSKPKSKAKSKPEPQTDSYQPSPPSSTSSISSRVPDTYIPTINPIAPVPIPVPSLKVPLLHNIEVGEDDDGDEYEDERSVVVPREMLLSERVQLLNEKLRQLKEVSSITATNTHHHSPSNSPSHSTNSSNGVINYEAIELIQTNFEQLSPCIETLFLKNTIHARDGLTLHLFKLYLFAIQYYHQDYFDSDLKDQFRLLLNQLIIINDNINEEFKNKFVNRRSHSTSSINGKHSPSEGNHNRNHKQVIRREIIKISIPAIIYKRLEMSSTGLEG